MKKPRNRGRLGGLLAIVLVMLACSGLGDLTGENSQQATADALAAAIENTRLANAITSTANALATETQKAQPTAVLPSVTPLPSITPNAEATAAAEATLSPIRSALASYGIDPSQGQLGWVHRPVTIELNSYGAQDYATDYGILIVRNFVVQADVTWVTRTGLAGCGFVFRADQEENFYGVGIFRGATGVAGFGEYRNGRVVNNGIEFRDAPATLWRNEEVNRLALVALENTFTLYVNGQFSHQISYTTLQSGVTAFAALSESGTSICTFNNGWLWVLD
jgi:hypothetical protein